MEIDTPVYLPEIAECDFEEVRQLLGPRFKQTYSDWQALRRQWLADFPGDHSISVRVDPNLLRMHLGSECCPDPIKALLDFIKQKPKQN